MTGRPPRPTAENRYRATLQAIAAGRPGMGRHMPGIEAQTLARKALIEMGDDWKNGGDNETPRLKKAHTAEATYHQARRFYDAYNALTETLNEGPAMGVHILQMQVPRVTLLAFSCELFLKSLIHHQTRKPANVHRLDLLFGKLNEPFKMNFVSALIDTGCVADGDFDKQLAGVSNAFVKLRYLNEEIPDGVFNSELLLWICALADGYFAAQEPDWKLRYEHMAAPDEGQAALKPT
ncbi:MAG: hypothetical protein ACRYHQ_39280 [Janthinobacterium lividum]